MSLSFIPSAYATTSGTSATSSMNFMSFLPMVIIFVLFWFLLVRPQQKKAKTHNQMVNALKIGDNVLTNSGILGKIAKINDLYIDLEIADNVVIVIQKSSIAGKIEKPNKTKE